MRLVPCKPYNARLTVVACAKRYAIANAPDTRMLVQNDNLKGPKSAQRDKQTYSFCVGCRAGEKRAQLVPAERLQRKSKKVIPQRRQDSPLLDSVVRIATELQLFSPRDIKQRLDQGSPGGVTNAIHRLKQRGIIVRVSKGIYEWVGRKQ